MADEAVVQGRVVKPVSVVYVVVVLRCETEQEVETDVVNGVVNWRGSMPVEGIGDEVTISDRTAGSVSVTQTTD